MRNWHRGLVLTLCGVAMLSCGADKTDEMEAGGVTGAQATGEASVSVSPEIVSQGAEKRLIGEVAERETFCALLLSGEAAGYARISISRHQEPGFFSYRHGMTMQQPGGVVIVAEATATLDGQFAPKEVELSRQVHLPDGQTQSQVDRMVVFDTNLMLSTHGAERPAQREVPLPEMPFVFGIECLLGSVNLAENPTFSLYEVNPQDGTTKEITFTATAVDGGFEVSSHSGVSGEQAEDAYVIGKDGTLLSIRMQIAPVEEQAITEAEYNALVKQLDLR